MKMKYIMCWEIEAYIEMLKDNIERLEEQIEENDSGQELFVLVATSNHGCKDPKYKNLAILEEFTIIGESRAKDVEKQIKEKGEILR